MKIDQEHKKKIKIKNKIDNYKTLINNKYKINLIDNHSKEEDSNRRSYSKIITVTFLVYVKILEEQRYINL